MEHSTFSHKLIAIFADLSGTTAYLSILGILFACGLGVPIPEDITLIAAGFLASMGSISLTGAYIVGYLGVLVGDTLLFFAGRRYGRKVFLLWPFSRIMTPARIIIAERKIKKNAKFICFIARFMPGLRAPIYLTCGVMGVSPRVFLFQDGFAALISVPVWVYLGYWFGSNIDQAFSMAKEIQIWILVGVLALIGFYFLKKKYFPSEEEELLPPNVTKLKDSK